MITTAVTLERALIRWRFLHTDLAPFALAVAVLDNAICQSDVDYAFALPDFLVRRFPTDPDVYEILMNGMVMIAYRLTERNPGADVEILP